MAEKKEKKIRKYKQLKACPKCGCGCGEHADRFSCGHCGYTEFKTQKKDTKREEVKKV